MSENINVKEYGTDYSNEADFLRSVNTLIEKLEYAMNNDMEIRPYKLKELINDVKTKKYIMLNCENRGNKKV